MSAKLSQSVVGGVFGKENKRTRLRRWKPLKEEEEDLCQIKIAKARASLGMAVLLLCEAQYLAKRAF